MSVGIIAEYNPFHNGHLYQINEVKKLYKDEPIILIMTGNFTERGDVALIDKFKRTEIAIKAGIDLVIELPYPFATQSADYFATGAVTLLNYLKVDKLVFGSESNDIESLKEIVKAQLEHEDFDKLVKIYSKFGENYPTALSLALKDITGKVITTPNDLLGISYIKAIEKNKYNIKPISIKRTTDYHEIDEESNIVSATSIRNSLRNNKDISKQVPEYSIKYLKDLHFIDDYFKLLKYKIITEKNLSIYQTVNEGIDKLLKKEIVNAKNYDDLIKKVKSKRYTYNKISRMLLHILVCFTKEDAKNMNEINYIRILGFNNKGRHYLNSIKKEINVELISKINRNKDKMLEFELETTKVYALNLEYDKQIELIKSEYRNNINKGE